MPKNTEIFAANVPRYTSYPTAPHFRGDVRADTYRSWLGSLDEGTPLSLYLHVPFCDSLCWFCGCHTSVVNNYRPVHDYCSVLLREVELVSSNLWGRRPVHHIHWGGGSPTILSQDDIRRLNGTIRSEFEVAPDAEFAIEIDPRGLDEEKVVALAGAGVNRASIGLQDCDPRVQRAINRVQSESETRDVVDLLRRVGIAKLNVDLIYGLPHQTKTGWRATLDFALSLRPDRLAVFGYAHVPTFKKHQALIRTEDLPGTESRLELADLARRTLIGAGYEAVGIDHFARHGDALATAARNATLHRNFQGYTTDDAAALLGFGASAISRLPRGYVQNLAAVPAWRTAVQQADLPVARGIILSPEDRVRGHVIERLMCDMQADLGDACARFGMNPETFRSSLAALSILSQQGLVSVRDGVVTVMDRSAARLAAAAFDAYLADANARHSLAV